jgi:hypothetical protein
MRIVVARFPVVIACGLCGPACGQNSDGSTPPAGAETQSSGSEITVAAYYFPNYHRGEPRNDKLKGTGWNEWELVKNAKPRFPGHHQPNVPLWGYTDESDPQIMAQKIDAAADHRIDAFIYPFMHTISGHTPDRFREALAITRQRLLARKDGPRIFNINCWNEWTEGSYLEPDIRHGLKYLEAVKDVFGE